MAKNLKANCHACGQKLAVEELACPRCKVSRKGDVNRPMVAAYGFFLLLMLVFGTATIIYLRTVAHINLP
jgi:hypothetical protein